jgi:flagellar biosynthesis/type III secretory pathway chaperone
MNEPINALTQILVLEADLHADFLTTLNDKRLAIIAGDIGAMEAALAREYDLLEKIRGAETHRIAAVATVAEKLALPTAPATLSLLIAELPAEQTENLRAAQTRLRDLLTQLQLRTRQVAELLKASMEHVNGFLSLIAESGGGTHLYNRQGKIAGAGARIINRQA